MFCPNCSAYCDDTYHFCIYCGTPLKTEAPAKKGSHWVPLLILAVMSIIGIGLFFATEGAAFNKPQASCFQVENGALLFHEEHYTGPTDVSVPEEVYGKTVRQIGESCFSGCDSIITVYLPETIESIGSRAFEDCISLRGIRLPESVTFIGTAAFAGCSDLEAICIPYSTGYIAPDAFDGCDSLNHIFYAGPYEDWVLLYGANMDPNVSIHCTDGNYCQGFSSP